MIYKMPIPDEFADRIVVFLLIQKYKFLEMIVEIEESETEKIIIKNKMNAIQSLLETFGEKIPKYIDSAPIDEEST